jgi:outer membrane receptor protein involved in Fe transport
VVVTNFDRPLQGSSPLLSNFDVFYNINKTSNIGLTYNYVGKKLNSVGVFGMGDIYQKSQHQLNMVYNIDKKKYSFSFRVNNVLNAKYELSQNTDIGNVVTHSFRTGQNVSMSLKYKF